jgi:PKD repeat protein
VANVAVTWSLINRTGGVAVSDLVAAGDTRSATFTGHAAGTGTIRAQHATLGSDSTGVITVTAGNQPPVALFKFEPKTGSPPCEICFDASSSYDPDGHIVSYDWSFGDGSAGDGANTCHTYTYRGDFLVTLKVTDNDGLSDTATAQIKLQAAVYPPINILLKREINRSLFRKEAFHTISWSFNPGNSSLTIVSYRIYRKEAGNGNESFQLIGTVSGDAFAYVDGYLDVYKKFIYAVTAVESSGHESQFSSLVGN